MAIDWNLFAFPKGESRATAKRTKLAAAHAEDRIARNVAWKRSLGRCEKCQRRVKRGGGLLDGAEFHHLVLRSLGGGATPDYLVTCHDCHFDGPSGAHTQSR